MELILATQTIPARFKNGEGAWRRIWHKISSWRIIRLWVIFMSMRRSSESGNTSSRMLVPVSQRVTSLVTCSPLFTKWVLILLNSSSPFWQTVSPDRTIPQRAAIDFNIDKCSKFLHSNEPIGTKHLIFLIIKRQTLQLLINHTWKEHYHSHRWHSWILFNWSIHSFFLLQWTWNSTGGMIRRTFSLCNYLTCDSENINTFATFLYTQPEFPRFMQSRIGGAGDFPTRVTFLLRHHSLQLPFNCKFSCIGQREFAVNVHAVSQSPPVTRWQVRIRKLPWLRSSWTQLELYGQWSCG